MGSTRGDVAGQEQSPAKHRGVARWHRRCRCVGPLEGASLPLP